MISNKDSPRFVGNNQHAVIHVLNFTLEIHAPQATIKVVDLQNLVTAPTISMVIGNITTI